jgi:Transmembrane secretion effector
VRRGEICLSADLTTAAAPTEPASSRWGPFGHLAFTVIWTASLVSNVGTAMFDTASGWLITSLDANPITVSLVQVAVSLPLFLFTLPSGALADVIDSGACLLRSKSRSSQCPWFSPGWSP